MNIFMLSFLIHSLSVHSLGDLYMASNERTRLRRQFRPGKGKYMKPETLQAFLLSAQELRGVELEFSVSHGVAVRASANLSDFSSIQDRPSNPCCLQYAPTWSSLSPAVSRTIFNLSLIDMLLEKTIYLIFRHVKNFSFCCLVFSHPIIGTLDTDIR